MRCPFCGYSDSKVLDSRPSEERNSIRRRRECLDCGKRFTTYEKIEDLPLVVVKKDGRREVFNPEKLQVGIMKACEKRPVSTSQIEHMVNEIEKELLNTMEREVSSKQIGEMVMERLRKIDEVAYVRFASVYRQFKDLQTFMQELENLLKNNKS
ncbi:transcriptional regulator NrdR [Calderihabitans maritimus]|uniref:Transcriptional repressor NrdR n=1 Tax=Calderihabitans maritimus TaxID=1246530 RepID=A0A1Z5HS27_9FIRM|nr:transcriptional regulator NrdR [Calderihabitans maritimus]GAW92131.1 transcriptional regulator NrdR [Calderihabitans maritimus]